MVDDNHRDRNLCRILLKETLGSRLEFFEAADAAAGLRLCREQSPDCVLLDYKLPDMTGIEFLEKLRSTDEPGIQGAAVVMLTGLADEQVAVDAMKSGAQDYLVKDRITPEGLLSAIEKAGEKVGLIRSLHDERDRLAQSVAEKDVLLREVHHRVKNNLYVIISLLNMQAAARSADGAMGEALAQALNESRSRIESMALVHEQLYQNDNLREVDLAKHASVLLSSLFTSYGVDPARISGSVNVDPLPVGVDRAIPAGLILNELISNALKHGFRDGRSGSIRVEGGRSNGKVTLAVRDDGIGIPEGVEPRRSGSLGLEIVRILTKQLNGVFELDRTGSTTFRISFPEE